MHVAVLEEGNRIQLPSEGVAEIGLSDKAELKRVAGGILIHSRYADGHLVEIEPSNFAL